MSKVTTYPEMNAEIVNLLRITDDKADMYAAQYIEELRKEQEHLVYQIQAALFCLAGPMGYSTEEVSEKCLRVNSEHAIKKLREALNFTNSNQGKSLSKDQPSP